MLRAVRLTVSGIVQGVGFRPFVYRAASKAGVKGYVRNIGGSAVEIHVEGEEKAVEEFLRIFREEKPETALLEEVKTTEVRPEGYGEFTILKSEPSVHRSSMIPPDFSICDECLREVLNPSSRFHLYPFHSCAYCGPRYSMIERIPYDRENTAMRDFPLCEKCRSEYNDPLNLRRFHAQGISCPECGPRVKLLTPDFELLEDGYRAIKEAGRLIDEGAIVAVKGLGGYHVAASATSDEVVMKLRERKRRPSKPFALMALNPKTVEQIVYLNEPARALLVSKEKPIVLLEKREDAGISEMVAPGLRHLGVFLPYTALHHLLLSNTRDKFTIMTSGNPPGEPMCVDEECARRKLTSFVDYLLNHDRRIVNRVDDSVVRFTRGKAMLLRRGRGYAPMWVKLPFKVGRTVVAFGAMLQSAGAVAFEERVVLTQYIGDVDEYHSFRDLEKYLKFLTDVYRIDVASSILVHDLHPRYPSTMLAREWGRSYGAYLRGIQHHWAHLAAVMAEFGLEDEVVGIAVDGVGYGADGGIWGGEVMFAGYGGFERRGHLALQPMPGGDRAVEYPARMLTGILAHAMGREETVKILRRLGIAGKGFPRGEEELKVALAQVPSAPRTSSTGRVLDAVSAMLNICFRRTYEGEPAIRLEAFSKPCNDLFHIRITGPDILVLDTSKIVLDALQALLEGRDPREVGYLVQKSLGYGLGEIARRCARRRHEFVVMSGGAAVNEYLVEGVEEALANSSLTLLLPKKFPANDGGIALGQAAIAAYQSLTET